MHGCKWKNSACRLSVFRSVARRLQQKRRTEISSVGVLASKCSHENAQIMSQKIQKQLNEKEVQQSIFSRLGLSAYPIKNNRKLLKDPLLFLLKLFCPDTNVSFHSFCLNFVRYQMKKRESTCAL